MLRELIRNFKKMMGFENVMNCVVGEILMRDERKRIKTKTSDCKLL
jgi:hypothetical protein